MLIDSWIVASSSSGYIAGGNVTPVWDPFTSVSRKDHLIFLWFDEWPTSFLRTHGNFTYLLGEKGVEGVRLTLQLCAVGRYYKKANMILSASVWEGRDSVCIHILPNTLNCSCLPGKRLVRLSLTQNYLWNAFLHCTIFSIPEAPFHSKNPFPLTLKLVFRPLLWERGDCSEWNGVFSRKRLSGLSCPRRANILVCRHHTSPYHSAIAQLLYKMPMISLILFFFFTCVSCWKDKFRHVLSEKVWGCESLKMFSSGHIQIYCWDTRWHTQDPLRTSSRWVSFLGKLRCVG